MRERVSWREMRNITRLKVHCIVNAYAEAEGCLFLSLFLKLGGVTLSGDEGVLLLPVAFMK